MSTAIREVHSPIHGYTLIAWDDGRIPLWVWREMKRTTNQCWLWPSAEGDPRMFFARRIAKVTREQVIAIVPTCGDLDCCNPQHSCLTLKGT